MSLRRRAFIRPTTYSVFNTGAMVAGSTNVNVLRWSATAVPSDGYLVVADSITLGMTWTLNASGIWQVKMNLLQVLSTTLRPAISLNGLPAGNPVFGTDGVIAGGAPQVLPGATGVPIFLATTIRVADSAIGAILRTIATDGAGATAAAAISAVAGTSSLEIIRDNDAG